MLTPTQAVAAQKRLSKIGLELAEKGLRFRKALRAFRSSGGWAVTPQHHRTWKVWCKWFAPKVGLTANTLAIYSNPQHERERRKWQEKRNHGIHVSGSAVKWLFKAIEKAHASGIKEKRQDGTNEALLHIAKVFLALTDNKKLAA
jgi:hypothetical protein